MNRIREFYEDIIIQIRNIVIDLFLVSVHFFRRLFKTSTKNLMEDEWLDLHLKNQIYGGNQNWFPTKVAKESACGTTSAADITAYLAKYYDEYSALYAYDKNNISNDDFLKHMEEIYKFLYPTKVPFVDKKLIGVPFAESYGRGIKKFAKSRGVSLKIKIFSKKLTKLNAIEFIQEGLKKDRPVAMIQWENRTLEEYMFHWMTIVGIEKDEKSDDIFINFLTWGRFVKFNIDEILKPKGVLKNINFLYIE